MVGTYLEGAVCKKHVDNIWGIQYYAYTKIRMPTYQISWIYIIVRFVPLVIDHNPGYKS